MYRIGVDLGGTNIAVGLVNEKFEIVKKVNTPTLPARGAEAIVDDIASLCKKACEEHGVSIKEVDAIGIASPGVANFDDGRVEYCSNLPFRHFPICKMIAEKTGVESVHVENDANAAAWGEAVAGAAKGTRSSIMITLGTGVGGGIIIDGKVYSGFNYAGAELGHIVIEYNGKLCGCGRRGCWEAYSSATGLIKMTKEKLEECEMSGRATIMKAMVDEKGKVSGRTAFDAMRRGDEAGAEVVDMYVRYLACGLANIINIFQPEVVSIGGGVSNEKDELLSRLLPIIASETYGAGFVEPTKIRIAELGNDAGIIGAAYLGI